MSNANLRKEYQNIFNSYEAEGIIQRTDELGVVGKVHYLPHRAIIRLDKETTKVRVVFDGSAKTQGTSLNDCIYTGPCLLNGIFGILLRFRMWYIGIISDTKQAFLIIGICQEHRDYLRFLWFDDVDSKNPKIIIYKLLRVVKVINCSPFLLNATIDVHLKSYESKNYQLAQKLLSNLYVDDVASGLSSVEDGIQFFKFANPCMRDGGFQLRKWCSNSDRLNAYFPNEESTGDAAMKDDDPVIRNVLGLKWNINTDTFVFSFEEIIKCTCDESWSKWSILKAGARFYDPLGMISPITIQA